MSVIRVGSTSMYAEGWDAIFGGRRSVSKRSGTAGSATSRPAARKAAKKKTVKKKASRVAKKQAITKGRKRGKSRRG